MKTMLKVLVILAVAAQVGFSQNVNWRAMRGDRPNLIQLNVGYDFAATTQVAYSRTFTLIRPVLVGLSYSLPMGNRPLDDFAVRLGGQVEAVNWGAFSATVKITSNLRRFQNDLVRMVSFGADFAAVAGYYDPAWYAAAECGFDKAVTTHLKHSDVMKEFGFSGVRDGWYVPTGGNFYYGIQAGKTLGDRADVSLRFGATNAQFDDENALLPYYIQLGFGLRF